MFLKGFCIFLREKWNAERGKLAEKWFCGENVSDLEEIYKEKRRYKVLLVWEQSVKEGVFV